MKEVTVGAVAASAPNNPLVALLSEDRQRQFATLSPEQQNAFYGRVMSSVFSSDAYQKLAFDTAASEFDKMAASRKK